MSLFSDNIRHLRLERKLSQEHIASELLITRGRYVKYEDGTSEAPYEILLRLSHYHHVSIDILLTVDIRKIDMKGLIKLEGNRVLLPILVDSKGGNAIEIIPHKAKAGYLNGYGDPEFIEHLEQVSLPFLKDGKFRIFPIEGDSMPPHGDGSYIVGKFVESHRDIKEGRTYILLTKEEGIVYKRLYCNPDDTLMLVSDNTYYGSYTVGTDDILELWEFAGSIATKESELDRTPPKLKRLLMEIEHEVQSLQQTTKK